MKKTCIFVLGITVALYCSPAFAQHGGGRPAGVGPGSSGAPASVGSGTSGAGSAGMGHSGVASASPTSVLNNTHVTTALTNSLTKSGVTIPGGNLKTACARFKNLGQCVT